MSEELESYRELFQEMSSYESKGVSLGIDGNPASPTQIVRAHMLRENSGYMRDYILDEKGDVKKLYFYQVEENSAMPFYVKSGKKWPDKET